MKIFLTTFLKLNNTKTEENMENREKINEQSNLYALFDENA